MDGMWARESLSRISTIAARGPGQDREVAAGGLSHKGLPERILPASARSESKSVNSLLRVLRASVVQ